MCETASPLHDWNIIVNSGSMLLSNALRNPNDVSVLLLLQLQQRIEHPIAELSHKSIQVHFDLLLKELILNRLVTSIRSNILKQWLILLANIKTKLNKNTSKATSLFLFTTYRIALSNHSNLLVLFSFGKLRQTIWKQATTSRIQLGAFVLCQLNSKRVDCDHECSSISLELIIKLKFLW